ncbi:unnamed protein product, partial [Mesorhabditis belari]|uniref:MAM domain-containing protein n=1 Tax=Mesorhabditis belari TaxID=2138241 RepID=A0AAF3FH70_9BILA
MLSNLVGAIVFCAFLQVSSGCMPGYEDERDRLREHLGIEWIPHGLDKSGITDRPIRRSSDLNCDFDDPIKCKWKNLSPQNQMDSLEFHLFEKVDWTEFPALQIQPGPSKVSQGNRMIFTGDKKRQEQTAIFYSSPIGCQNSTGNFTFTYWAYNNARVEILLYEDQPNGRFKELYEKPYVDCGTINLNTDCHAEIPPRDTPFRIAIRAYDMASKEGSFVMVDNIIYTADLCKIGVDLGENFVTQPLLTSAIGKDIQLASHLDCADFNEKCRWRSGGQANKMWRRSTSSLPRDFLFNTTGSYIGPSGPYAVLYIDQDTKAPLDILKSDPIPCQSQTENKLTFKWWATRDVRLDVCAVEIDGRGEEECHRLPSETSPAPAEVAFRRAANNFMIQIRVTHFNPDFDSVVIIDDMTYRATLCSDPLSVFDIGEHFVSTPMLSILLHRHVNSAKELSCDFSKRAADCVWGSTEYNNVEDSELLPGAWQVGHGPLNEEKLYSLSGQVTVPEGEFAIAKFETGGSSLLLSEVIRCVLDDVSISFNMWTTGTASLQVCLVEESSPSLLDCQPATSGPVVVDLPAISKPFRIALRANAEDQGMVIVDDIDVQGSICPAIARQFASKHFSPAVDQPDPNVCRLLSCDFSGGHACLYAKETIPGSAPFRISTSGAFAKMTRGRPLAVLESVPFRLNTISRLHFNYKTKGDALLYVCNDSAKKELETCFKVEGNDGDDYIELLPSDTKVYLIGRLNEESSTGRGSLKITRLNLTDTIDEPAC